MPMITSNTAEARSIAKDAYVYAFAMLENYNTMFKQQFPQDCAPAACGQDRFSAL
jgi:hypothetical protein